MMVGHLKAPGIRIQSESTQALITRQVIHVRVDCSDSNLFM